METCKRQQKKDETGWRGRWFLIHANICSAIFEIKLLSILHDWTIELFVRAILSVLALRLLKNISEQLECIWKKKTYQKTSVYLDTIPLTCEVLQVMRAFGAFEPA